MHPKAFSTTPFVSIRNYLNKYLSTGSNILDIGRGTGRDLANLMIQDDSLGKDTQWCVQIWRKGKVSQR